MLLSNALPFEEYPVVGTHVQDVIQLLNHEKSDDVLLLGILGMVGIGKTTIAKALYRQIGMSFEDRKFLQNIRVGWERNGKDSSQQEPLYSSIDSILYGEHVLQKKLCNKRVFIVLDNVTEFNQLEALCGCREWFGKGSRIIITTRDEHLLNKLGVDHVYRVKEMDNNESVELFSWHAFNKATPEMIFARLAEHAVEYCGGLPLALRVLGSFLCEKSIEEWESVLEKVKSSPLPDIQNKLKTSFDQLSDDSVKEMFLDIACFFVGMNLNDVIETLNVSKYNAKFGIEVLQKQSLVTVDEKKNLRMHNLLQQMGQEIVHKASNVKTKQMTYDVFLSFRGKDTRATFVSHLQTSLENAGIYVFKDDVALPRGEQISVALLKGIRESRISVVVLSTNYADSRWCLQELENIMTCYRTKAQVVVPLFYGVDPSDVRKQAGMFGEAFKNLTERISVSEDKMLRWRTALREVGSLSGIVVVNSSNESEDIKKVVEDVTRLLDKTELFVAGHPVGLNSQVEYVTELLKKQKPQEVLLLGILGMGGIGKTTIAKAIYNKIGRKFDGRSFLLDIKDVWGQDNGRVSLQQRLLSDIYKTTKIVIHDVESGKIELKERLSRKRVLLVLDDINKLDQMNALFGSHEWVCPGSCIIITTRDERLVRGRGVDPVIYRLEEMNNNHGVELFSWHAFKQASPKEEFVGLSREIVKYSSGLPLALEVLGSYLCDRKISEWKCVLEKIKRIPHQEIQTKLRISFDGLSEDNEKEIFLDIACFFIGMDRSDVIQILNTCKLYAEIGISILKERSLVTVDNKNKLGMHDLLRDMGREIVRERSREPEKRSRLWDNDAVLGVLKEYKGTKAIQGLALKSPWTTPISLHTKAFKKMKKLRLLQLAGVKLDGDFKYLSRDLKWMNWHGFPSRDTPKCYHQKKLVAVELEYSNLEYFVWNKAQVLINLKILNLSNSFYLRETPDFSCLPNLEKLKLKNCTSLSSVSHTIGQLKEILVINLKNCTSLSELPRSIFKLKSLTTLILSGCWMIDKLEEDMAQMESLTILKANNTAITQVPNALIRSKSAGHISLCGFTGLARDVIPDIIWSQASPTNKFLSVMRGMSTQITRDSAWDTFDDNNFKELEAKPTTSEVSYMNDSEIIGSYRQGNISGSKNPLNFLLIQMGMNSPATEISRESISEKLGNSGPEDCLLPSDRSPDWFTFSGEGSTVIFQVPQVNGCNLKSMMLTIVYSSSTDIITSESLVLKNVMIINHTKITTQVYEGDTMISFKDEDWESLISSLEPGDQVQVVVVLGYGFIVQKTTAYLIFDESIDQNMYIASSGDHVVADMNEDAFGVDDMAEKENATDSNADHMLSDMNGNSSGPPGVDDLAPDESANMQAHNNNDIVSGGDENIFRRFFKLPSLVCVALKMRQPFWYGLLVILSWITCRHSDKRKRLKLISRYALWWKWLVDCQNKLIAYKKSKKAHGSIESSSSVS